MKQTVIILISAIIIIFTSIFLYRMNIEKNSVMTCIRENKDRVVIKFDVTGIESLEINEKKVSEEEFTLYLINFIYDFSKIEINEENYTELELIKKYMEIVTDYEENNEDYNSVCVQD